jgi:hypothetical protein
VINRIITGKTQFTDTELQALQSLRAKYRAGQHIFTPRELAHLRFLRWLVNRPDWNRSFDRGDGTHLGLAAGEAELTWTLGFARSSPFAGAF